MKDFFSRYLSLVFSPGFPFQRNATVFFLSFFLFCMSHLSTKVPLMYVLLYACTSTPMHGLAITWAVRSLGHIIYLLARKDVSLKNGRTIHVHKYHICYYSLVFSVINTFNNVNSRKNQAAALLLQSIL